MAPSLTLTDTTTPSRSASTSPKSPGTANRGNSGSSIGNLSLRSPVLANPKFDIPRPSTSGTPTDENLDHAYRRAGETDFRSPCPALNTLANHGYLPRDGKNIHISELLEALKNSDTYNLTHELADVLVYGGAYLSNHSLPSLLPILLKDSSLGSLQDLAWHNEHGVEHDASMVHKDTPKGAKFAPTRTDTRLLNDFLGDRPTIELADIARRRVELERDSPLDGMHAEIARGEWALVLGIFGSAHDGKIPADALRVWLAENRFPDGWHPSHQQGFLKTKATAGEIRHAMDHLKSIEKREGWDHFKCPFTTEPDEVGHKNQVRTS